MSEHTPSVLFDLFSARRPRSGGIFAEPIMQQDAMTQFKQSLRGRLIARADSAYEEAQKLYNGMINKRPLMIVQCADVADVVAAVGLAREYDLRVAIRGGGHNGAGPGSIDDRLMIDMSMMKGVRVDGRLQRLLRDRGIEVEQPGKADAYSFLPNGFIRDSAALIRRGGAASQQSKP